MKTVTPSGKDFMSISLMADVPYNLVTGRIKTVVQGNRQLNGAKIGTEMTTCGRNGVQKKFPDLNGKIGKLFRLQFLQIGWRVYSFKQHVDSLPCKA